MGEEEIKTELTQLRYCNPKIHEIRSIDIGEWHDDHPMNRTETADKYFDMAFLPIIDAGRSSVAAGTLDSGECV